ncbi:response regulator transcription factor [Lapillicoccus sp.]|uniref:response regulator transcription factor n=1 Tax=Lapillicoccus sp. TaxID=1909287 RepID=UPI0025FDE37B|nr:response regulator transcription factor [Lapillicoccus sp.]
MRVVIGEDEALLREGLAYVLNHGGFDVVASAGNGADLLRLARQHEPELVITDIRMPPGHTDEGLRAALQIRQLLPHTAIVVLSQHLQRQYAVELVAEQSAGVGYLLKQRIADIATFCGDLLRVCAGEIVLDPEVVLLMLTRARTEGHGVQRLTARQQEVLDLMAQGLNNAAIARRLLISEKAVVSHASHIYDELGLQTDDDSHRRVLAVLSHLNR